MSTHQNNTRRAAITVLMVIGLLGCDFYHGDETTPHELDRVSISPRAIALADTVVTNKEATVYQTPNPSSEVSGTAPSGSRGVVERGPRNDMWMVRFIQGSTPQGWVFESDLQESDTGDPPPPPPPPGNIALGGASCSMGRDFFIAYSLWADNNPNETRYPHWPNETESGDKITKSWSGGGLDSWGLPGSNGYNIKWASFDTGVAYLEPTVLLFMVCDGDANINGVIDPDEIDMALHVREQMLARVPNAQLWITGQPRHEPGSECDTPTPGLSHALADSAAARGWFQRADIDIVLTPEQANPVGCHVNDEGFAYEGPIMAAWLASLDE